MDTGFIVGLLLAIPLGILTNLATPWVQQKLATRSSRVREARERERQADDSLARALSQDSARHLGYIHTNMAKLLTYVLIMTAIANFPYYINDLTRYAAEIAQEDDATSELVYAAPTILLIVLFIFLITAFINTARKTRRISELVSVTESEGKVDTDNKGTETEHHALG